MLQRILATTMVFLIACMPVSHNGGSREVGAPARVAIYVPKQGAQLSVQLALERPFGGGSLAFHEERDGIRYLGLLAEGGKHRIKIEAAMSPQDKGAVNVFIETSVAVDLTVFFPANPEGGLAESQVQLQASPGLYMKEVSREGTVTTVRSEEKPCE